MSDKRQTFTTEFKYEVAIFVIDQGCSYPAASKAVGSVEVHCEK